MYVKRIMKYTADLTTLEGLSEYFMFWGSVGKSTKPI